MEIKQGDDASTVATKEGNQAQTKKTRVTDSGKRIPFHHSDFPE